MDIVKLRELLERELSSNELTPLDDEFYKEFDSLVKALKLRVESSRERGETVEENLYLAELEVVERLMKEIIKIRLHKLVDLAFEGKLQNLVGEEKKIFGLLLAFINREPFEIPERVVEEKIEEVKEVVETKIPTREAYLIEIDIPKILDEKLNEYGPFKAGDLVTLPRSLAKILIERGVAKRVRIS